MQARYRIDIGGTTLALDLNELIAIESNDGGEVRFYFKNGQVIQVDDMEVGEDTNDEATLSRLEREWSEMTTSEFMSFEA